jgi:hypothetical protein
MHELDAAKGSIENIYPDKRLRRCEALLRNAREIGAGGLFPPSSGNLKRKLQAGHVDLAVVTRTTSRRSYADPG